MIEQGKPSFLTTGRATLPGGIEVKVFDPSFWTVHDGQRVSPGQVLYTAAAMGIVVGLGFVFAGHLAETARQMLTQVDSVTVNELIKQATAPTLRNLPIIVLGYSAALPAAAVTAGVMATLDNTA